MQFLCNNLRQNKSGALNRSGMPGHELLDMHVDARRFWELCEWENKMQPLAEAMAPHLHEDWRKYPGSEGNSLNKPWKELTESDQDSNIQQALRIITNLAIVGLRIEKGRKLALDQEKTIRKCIDRNTEIMAEAEHNGWMVERIIKGWRYARIPKKIEEKKLHPLLLPYSQLPDDQKEKDRRPIRGFRPNKKQKKEGEKAVVGYVDRLKRTGYRIVPICESAQTSK